MAKSSYVGAVSNYDDDTVMVWERESTNERILRKFKAPKYFYTPNDDGEFTSIYGQKLEKHVFDSVEDRKSVV